MIFAKVCLTGVLASAFCLAACAKKNKSATPAEASVPADFSIEFGEGGGMTGTWQGYTIKADGTVFRWKGRTAGQDAEKAGKLSAAQMQSIWNRVQETGFFASSVKERGNMTTVMRVTANNAEHSVSWSGVRAQEQAEKASLQTLLQFCRETVAAVPSNY